MLSLIPTGFHSFSEYGKFVWAREFHQLIDHEKIIYAKTRLELIGDFMVYPIMKISDHTLRNIRNPLMILSITLTAILAVTILFYPQKLMHTIIKFVPYVNLFKPWMIKATAFTTFQATVLGVGLRSLGRLDPNGALWRLWNMNPRQIMPIAVGTQVVPHPS